MGNLLAGNQSFPFDDRVLAHIRVAFALQLQRGEGFFFSWHRPLSEGSGHLSMWVPPAEIVVFEFFGNREPRINREWVHAIITSTGGGSGLKLVPEPGTAPFAPPEPEEARSYSS